MSPLGIILVIGVSHSFVGFVYCEPINNGTNPNCTEEFQRQAQMQNRECLKQLFEAKLNQTASLPSHCTTIEDAVAQYNRTYTKLAGCFNGTLMLVIKSVNTRLRLIKELTENPHFSEIYTNKSTLKCMTQYIQSRKKCENHFLGNITKPNPIRGSSLIAINYFTVETRRAQYQQKQIENCAIKYLNCNNKTNEFIKFIHQKSSSLMSKYTINPADTAQSKSHTRASKTGLIIGAIAAVAIAATVVGVAIAYKKGIFKSKQDAELNVTFKRGSD